MRKEEKNEANIIDMCMKYLPCLWEWLWIPIMWRELSTRVIHVYEALLTNVDIYHVKAEGDGKHGWDDGTYGLFYINYFRICKDFEEHIMLRSEW